MARSASAGLASGIAAMMAARACSSAALAPASVSLASCASTMASALGVGIVEEILRGANALLRIGGADAERADGGFERAPHAIVDAHLLEPLDAFDLRAAPGVEGLAGGRLVDHALVGRIDIEAPVAERVEDFGAMRRRGGGDAGDRLFGLREFVGEKLGEGVVQGVGEGDAGQAREQSGDKQARQRPTRPAGQARKRAPRPYEKLSDHDLRRTRRGERRALP